MGNPSILMAVKSFKTDKGKQALFLMHGNFSVISENESLKIQGQVDKLICSFGGSFIVDL